jgi:hypothetical protein
MREEGRDTRERGEPVGLGQAPGCTGDPAWIVDREGWPCSVEVFEERCCHDALPLTSRRAIASSCSRE